jgi:predicted glycosyltransferase
LNRKLNIFISPLEWGLGHAARMIPLASILQEKGHNVIVGAGNEHLALFKAELPSLKLIKFPGFKPTYSKIFPQYLVMLLKTPLLIYHSISEHARLKKLIREYQIDIVISDNRFGLWNRKVTCVYVTHMLRIPFPFPFRFLEGIGIMIHGWIINRYAFCFVPDLPGDLNLSGRLSHNLKLPQNVIYTGILTRFSQVKAGNNPDFAFPHITVILSGPEPQRTILETKLKDELSDYECSVVLLKGRPGKSNDEELEGKFTYYNHLCINDMANILRSSTGIIGRSGYTTIMDLTALGCSALLIPTPGQTEQEYLADYLSERKSFTTVKQNKIRKSLNIPHPTPSFPSEINEQSALLLESALKKMLENVKKNS